MSYINMDHAGWVERNIAASKKQKATARDKRNAAEHKGWYAAPDELNPFQRRAIDILGIIGNGIYNAPISWDTVYWDKRLIAVSWTHRLGTFDFTALTSLVFLCHEARIRGEVSPKGFQHIEIMLSERSDAGGNSQRHPNLDEAIEDFRARFPAGHSISYAPAPRPPAVVGEGSKP